MVFPLWIRWCFLFGIGGFSSLGSVVFPLWDRWFFLFGLVWFLIECTGFFRLFFSSRGNWHSHPHFRGTHSYVSETFFEQGFKIADLAAPEWTYTSGLTGAPVRRENSFIRHFSCSNYHWKPRPKNPKISGKFRQLQKQTRKENHFLPEKVKNFRLEFLCFLLQYSWGQNKRQLQAAPPVTDYTGQKLSSLLLVAPGGAMCFVPQRYLPNDSRHLCLWLQKIFSFYCGTVLAAWFCLKIVFLPKFPCCKVFCSKMTDEVKKWRALQVSGLLFAGEATHDTFFSHVTGAVDSGYREAARINGFYPETSTVAPSTTVAPNAGNVLHERPSLIQFSVLMTSLACFCAF